MSNTCPTAYVFIKCQDTTAWASWTLMHFELLITLKSLKSSTVHSYRTMTTAVACISSHQHLVFILSQGHQFPPMCEGTLPDFHHHGWVQQKIQTNLEFLWDGRDYPAGQDGAWEALRQESSPAVPKEPTWPSSSQTSHVIRGATGQDTCLRDLNINHKNKAKGSSRE